MANRHYFGQLSVMGGAAGQVLVGGVDTKLTQFTTCLPGVGGENWGTIRSLAAAVCGMTETYAIRIAHNGTYRVGFAGRLHSTSATRVVVNFNLKRAGVVTTIGSVSLTFQAPLEEQSCGGEPVGELRQDDEIYVSVTADLATTLTLLTGFFNVQGVNPVMTT